VINGPAVDRGWMDMGELDIEERILMTKPFRGGI
jgi:hypothetical protein